MLLRFGFVVSFLLLLGVASAQDAGKLAGKVLDQEGNPLPFTTVVVYEGELVRYGTQTADDGTFSIQPVAPGIYRVEARYLQGRKALDNVSVIANQTRNITLTFEEDISKTLDEVEIFGNPVFERDPAVTTTLTSEDVQNIGTRDVESLAALTAGVYQSDEGDGNLSIRGARTASTVYYIDGVKIRGQTNLPQASIQQLQVITGGTPAEFGDFTGGVVNITTAGPSPDFVGSLELVTSQYLDAFGKNLAALSLSGPLITKTRTLEGTDSEYKTSVLGFFFNAEVDYEMDQDPAALGIYKLQDEALADLQERPVQVSGDGRTFFSRANFVKGDQLEQIAAKQNNENFRARGLMRLDFQPADNVLFKVGGNYEYILTDNWGIRSSLFAPDRQNQFEGGYYRGWARFQQSFSGGKDALVKNFFYSIQADYSLYQRRFQNQVHEENLWDYGYVGKFEFDEVPRYGYVSNPGPDDPLSSGPYWRTLGYAFENLRFDPSDTRNPLYANYNNTIFNYAAENGLTNIPEITGTFDPVTFGLSNLNDLAFRQGIVNGSSPGGIYSIFSGIGSNYGSYVKFDFEQFRLTGQTTAEIKGHNLKAGFEFEQRTERYYGLNARSLWSWARQYSNFHLLNLEDDPSQFVYGTIDGEFNDTISVSRRYAGSDQTTFDRNLREALGFPVDGTDYINTDAYGPDFYQLNWFSADELLADGIGPVSYYGFDYLGNKQPQVDAQSFFTDENRPQNAFSPTYLSAFFQDKFEFEDIIFNVGLRVDRFDANQQVLKDPFSLYPTYSAAEVASGQLGLPSFSLPTGIGDDFVPYVDNETNFSEVIGYRSGESWFTANGTPVSSAVIAQTSGGRPIPALRDDKVAAESFEDYSPQTVFMPRISFSFPISDVALFFAHYDVLSQRPGQISPVSGSLLAGQVSDYAFLENRPSTDVNNPNLKPEITVDYEAGFKQKIGTSMALTMSAFYREQRDMIRFRRFTNAYPFSYDTYDNLDFGTVKGFSFTYEMRRTYNVKLRASYTLQFADATGSSFSSARSVVNFLEGVGVLRNTLPTDLDQRHRVQTNIDYRFSGRRMGPAINMGERSIYPLKNFGVNLTGIIGSGLPFTKNAVAVPSVASGINIVNRVQGTPNGARRPWQFRADLQIDKSFTLGGKSKADGSSGRIYDFNVYLLMLNVFDTRNMVGVYRYTGLPDDDGFLASDSGEQFTVLQVDPEAFVEQYNIRLQNPNNYSQPRRVRLGVQFSF